VTGEFAGAAEFYERFRPAYPSVLLDHLRALVKPGGSMVDLAAGTGQIARPLCDHFASVRAVDAEPDMVALGRERSNGTGITWELGRAEDVEVADGSVDLVTIGNAFHRVDQPLVAANVRRWLAPGGWFAVLNTAAGWNGRRGWQDAARDVIYRWVPQPPPPTGPDQEAHVRGAGFVDVVEHRYHEERTWTVDAFVGYLYSTAVVSPVRRDGRAAAFEADLRAALAGQELTEELTFLLLLGRRP